MNTSKLDSPYSDWEWEEMQKMRKEGKTYREIAEKFGRTAGAVYMKFYAESGRKRKMEIEKKHKVNVIIPGDEPKKEAPVVQPPKPVREKALHDFTPREIIRHLYEIGYRIEDGQLIVIEKKVVNLMSVINEK